MSGVQVKIDEKIEEQVLAILQKHGLLESDLPVSWLSESELDAELEKGMKSGASKKSAEKIFAKYKK